MLIVNYFNPQSQTRTGRWFRFPSILLLHEKSQRFWTPGFLASVSALTCLAQTPPPTGLSAPLKQMVIPNAFSNKRSFPVISNGYLLSFQRTIKDRGHDNFFVDSLAGAHFPLKFRIEGAEQIRVEDVSATTSGLVVIAGSYTKAGATSEVNFVAEMDLDGGIKANLDLGPYTPERVCAASDGTFWTLGQEWVKERSGGAYDLLRQYSADGKLKRSYLSRNILPHAAELNFHAHGINANTAYLSCGDQSVGAYLGPGHIWIEVAEGRLRLGPIKPLPSSRMTGLTLHSEHVVFASFKSQRTSSPSRGLYQLDFRQPVATWVAVPGTVSSSDLASFSVLVGRDGPNIVHLRNQVNDSAGNPMLHWAKVLN